MVTVAPVPTELQDRPIEGPATVVKEFLLLVWYHSLYDPTA